MEISRVHHRIINILHLQVLQHILIHKFIKFYNFYFNKRFITIYLNIIKKK